MNVRGPRYLCSHLRWVCVPLAGRATGLLMAWAVIRDIDFTWLWRWHRSAPRSSSARTQQSRADVQLRCVACLGTGARERRTEKERETGRERQHQADRRQRSGNNGRCFTYRAAGLLKRPRPGNQPSGDRNDSGETLGTLASRDLCSIETLHRFLLTKGLGIW